MNNNNYSIVVIRPNASCHIVWHKAHFSHSQWLFYAPMTQQGYNSKSNISHRSRDRRNYLVTRNSTITLFELGPVLNIDIKQVNLAVNSCYGTMVINQHMRVVHSFIIWRALYVLKLIIKFWT